ncbi:MAG: hypothetical protein B7L53_05235 [Thermofilum sp. NZ13]|nr:MAG: hypothetical protein B7L53_05235 [Thermofilum sp. NZ13]
MVVRGRTLTLVFSTPEEAVQFLKTLERLLPGRSFLGELKVNKVKIFVPESDEAEKTIHKIKQLYNQQRHTYSYGVVKSYDLSSVLTLARLEAPIPATLIVEALKIQGFKAALSGDILKTDATLDGIIKTVERLSAIYKETLTLTATAQTRRLISLYAFAKGLRVEDAVDDLYKLGLLTETSGKVTLKVNYSSALSALLGSLKNSA